MVGFEHTVRKGIDGELMGNSARTPLAAAANSPGRKKGSLRDQ